MTSLDLLPFHPDHLRAFDPAERNGRAKQAAIAALAHRQLSAFTARTDDGVVLGCGGLVPLYAHRLYAWTSVSRAAPAMPLVRLIREYLDLQDALRIETVVDVDDGLCHKWVQLLGFKPEGPPLRYYNSDKTDAQMYVRCR